MQVPRWRRNPWCCAALHSVTNNLHVFLDSYWFDNLGFLLRENLLLYASHLPLGVPNGRVLTARIKLFFWRRCRGDQDTLQGESPTSNLFTLFFVLLHFILFTALFAFLLSKYKKISYCIYFIYLLFISSCFILSSL